MSTAPALQPETEETRIQYVRVKDVCKKLKIKVFDTHTLPIEDIADNLVESRAVTACNSPLINLYADKMSCGMYFPPIIVFKKDGCWYCVDGKQRKSAHESLGHKKIETIEVEFTSLEEMIALASALNGQDTGSPSPQTKEDFMSCIRAWKKLRIAQSAMVRFLSVSGLPPEFATPLVKKTCQMAQRLNLVNFKSAVNNSNVPLEKACDFYQVTPAEGRAYLAKTPEYPASVYGMHLAQMRDNLKGRFAKLATHNPGDITTAMISTRRVLTEMSSWLKQQEGTFRS
jgi:hypothetical protein